MDAKKTGAFIAQLRKEKTYTQKELAQRLNVSDKAISRWETGKGFPDTSLLKPLSDALGVSVGELLSGERLHPDDLKARVDNVIVTSMEDSRRKVNRVSVLCAVLAVLVLLSGVALLLREPRPSAVEFVNGSQTDMRYALTDDNSYLQTVYPDFEKREWDGGYEYYLPDGTERYVFTEVDGKTVMSYMHCSGQGRLFGVSLGDSTVVEANPILGVDKDYSLMAYLEENGFERRYDAPEFGRPNLVYIDGERCNWVPFTRDNVFINICISAYEGLTLRAYDIGLIEGSLEPVLTQVREGFPLTLEDPCGLVTGELKDAYQQWDTVTVTAGAPEGVDSLYLYINGQLVDKFAPPNPPFTEEFEISFGMWGAPITVLVTPEGEK